MAIGGLKTDAAPATAEDYDGRAIKLVALCIGATDETHWIEQRQGRPDQINGDCFALNVVS